MDMNQKARKKGLADRSFEVEDYNRMDNLSIGLAKTHEQVSDVYAKSGEEADLQEK